ncbi:MAG: hypothetical protein WCO68_05855 [Verrucomicrobiota bacterium]
MNHRLLTEEEKRLNALGRYTRKLQQRHDKRRDRLTQGLMKFFGISSFFSLLTPKEAFELAYGHGNLAKIVGKRLARRAIATKDSSNVPHMHAEAILLSPPRRILMLADWGAINPDLLPEQIPDKEYDDEATIQATTLKIANTAAANPEAFRHLLLDVLAQLKGLSYELSAAVLLNNRLISRPFSSDEINAVRQTRVFWSKFSYGRRVYCAELILQNIPIVKGDVAIFDANDLANFLPGIHIPVDLRRQDYLVILVRDEKWQLKFLDVYSIRLKPLFRVPVTPVSGIVEPQCSRT